MKLTGKAYIYANGELLRTMEGARLTNFSSVEREPVVASTGTVGYREKDVTPTIECTVAHASDTSLTALASIIDATITFETDGGPVYILRGAWTSNALEISDGELTLTFAGLSCEELSS